jgi:predicted DNA-binding protein (UPF0278 family)
MDTKTQNCSTFSANMHRIQVSAQIFIEFSIIVRERTNRLGKPRRAGAFQELAKQQSDETSAI